VFVLSDHARWARAVFAGRPCGSPGAHIAALGGRPLGLPRHAANQDDEHHRDRGADDVTDDVYPPPGEVPADDVGLQRAGRQARFAAGITGLDTSR
jgi:hypothetical protein